MKRLIVQLATIVGVMLSSENTMGDLIINGGFESPFTTSPIYPTTYGVWEFDPASSVTAMDGIVPLEGERMLQFEAAGRDLSLYSSDCWQLVDMNPYQATISDGAACLTASAWFNRVPGDNETDTLFKLILRAYNGTPDQFSSLSFIENPLASTISELFSDDDVSTWESTATQLLLPANTSFVGIRVSAFENGFNDLVPPEFDGHFVDNVSLQITPIPEPSTLATWGGLLAMGLIGGCWRRRRKR